MEALKTILTPFDDKLVITLLDADCNPVALSTLTDVKVVLELNGLASLQFAQAASTGVIAWIPGPADTQGNVWTVLCPVTQSQTDGWRGLLAAQVQLVSTAAGNQPVYPQALYILALSEFTTVTPQPVNPISFTTSFSCDENKNLTFSCTVETDDLPDGNYIVQVQINDLWQQLYSGYVPVVSGTGTYATTSPVGLGRQIAAGTYPVRVMNDMTGQLSAPVDTFIADCRQGQEPYNNGCGYPYGYGGFFNVYGPWE